MTPSDRLESALRSAWLPLALLLIALSTVFIFGGDRGYFYRRIDHNWLSSHHLTVALNISSEYGFQRFDHRAMNDDGAVGYVPYNRFPIGSYLLLKAATLPFGGDPSAQLYAARIIMLLCFTSAAVVAYLSLCRLTSNRWIALTAALLAFSAYYLLYYNDMTAGEGMMELFGVMATFHGMVVFVQGGHFRQLLIKTCIALLIGWHVLALVAPFVIFGLARELWQARSASATSISPVMSSRHLASKLLRSRYLLLGAAALGFSLCVLTFNFTMEYIALDGETPLTELPSFQSMLRRTGADSDYNMVIAPYRDWSQFIEGQFRSIGRMFIPYSLLGSLRYNGPLIQSPTWLTEFQGAVLGVALSAACLIGSMFVRPRILFATLALFGFFWALPMRNYVAVHDFEPIYYIGLPLVFFAIVLLLVRRVTNRDGVITAAAASALLLFTISGFQMSSVGHSAEAAQRVRAAEQDLLTIRELVAEDILTVVPIGGHHVFFFDWAGHALNYYLHHRIIRYRDPPPSDRGFVLTQERVDIDALLTPQNQYFFLYDTAGLMDWYRSAYRSVVSTEPLARGEFDVYLIDGTVYYLKEPCYASDFTAGLFLHVFPVARGDLPNKRRLHGFDNLDFTFYDHGLLFDDKCLAGVDLPQYDIAGIRTGQPQDSGTAWTAAHVVQGPKLVSEYESIVSGEPTARAEFDVYFDRRALYYVKEQCGARDVREGFFLHVVPANLDDLPDGRKEYGFDNLDFRFDVYGVLFDGKCAAAVRLPEYGIARITTGQFDGVDRVWEVEFAPEANE